MSALNRLAEAFRRMDKDGDHDEYIKARGDVIKAAREVLAERVPAYDYGLPCGLSWAGCNVWGDEKSVAVVKQALHDAATVPALRERIAMLAAAPAQAPAQDYAQVVEALRLCERELRSAMEDGQKGQVYFDGDDCHEALAKARAALAAIVEKP